VTVGIIDGGSSPTDVNDIVISPEEIEDRLDIGFEASQLE
jgi:hypothetical protein